MGKTSPTFPFPNNTRRTANKTKPVQVVALNDYEYLQEHPEHPLHKCSLVLPLEIKTEFENQNEKNINKPRTPFTFLRDYIRRLKRNEEPTFKIDHVNRPAAPSQPIYTHIPEHPPISHYGAYPLRTINTGNVLKKNLTGTRTLNFSMRVQRATNCAKWDGCVIRKNSL